MNAPVAGPTFALIGVAGYIARRHLEAIRDVGDTLIACSDITGSAGILDSYFPDAIVYQEIIAGRGHRLEDAAGAVELAERVRQMAEAQLSAAP